MAGLSAKDQKELIRSLEEQGVVVSVSSTNQAWRFHTPDGRYIGQYHSTTSDYRGHMPVRSALKRFGYHWPFDGYTPPKEKHESKEAEAPAPEPVVEPQPVVEPEPEPVVTVPKLNTSTLEDTKAAIELLEAEGQRLYSHRLVDLGINSHRVRAHMSKLGYRHEKEKVYQGRTYWVKDDPKPVKTSSAPKPAPPKVIDHATKNIRTVIGTKEQVPVSDTATATKPKRNYEQVKMNERMLSMNLSDLRDAYLAIGKVLVLHVRDIEDGE
jgi:hypothetical protein